MQVFIFLFVTFQGLGCNGAGPWLMRHARASLVRFLRVGLVDAAIHVLLRGCGFAADLF